MDQRIKTAKLVSRLYHIFKGKKPLDIYRELISNQFYREIFDRLDDMNVLLFCFSIPNIQNESEIGKIFEQIESNLFVYSVVEVGGDSYENCEECNGNGEITCHYCGGDGEVECEECGGSGEDEEGEECSYCDGKSQVDCDECGGGYLRCEYCDGNGDIVRDDYNTITQYQYVSFDKNVFEKLELLTDESEIPPNMSDYILQETNKTFLIFSEEGDSNDFNGFDYNSNIFCGLVKNPTFSRVGRQRMAFYCNEITDYTE